MMEITLADEQAMLALAERFARSLPCDHGLMIYLLGELGAGKTTFCRGVLRGLGYDGIVRSPTYTLVETYQFPQTLVHHFDLYRLSDPEELEYLGGRDYFSGQAICLVEWPQRGAGYLPPADLVIELQVMADGRVWRVDAQTASGKEVIQYLRKEVL